MGISQTDTVQSSIGTCLAANIKKFVLGGPDPNGPGQEFVFANSMTSALDGIQGWHNCGDRASPSNRKCFLNLPCWPVENFRKAKPVIPELVGPKTRIPGANKILKKKLEVTGWLWYHVKTQKEA